MKVLFTLPCCLAFVMLLSTNITAQTDDCLLQIIHSEPYRAKFDTLEQALLQSGLLSGTSGQAYREMALKVYNQNDLSILMPVYMEPALTSPPYPCEISEDHLVLFGKLGPILDTIAAARDLSPRLIVGAFLEQYDETDWDMTITKHLFYMLIANVITADKGILVQLPPWQEIPVEDYLERNILRVEVDGNNQLWIEGEKASVNTLRAIAKEFIMNRDRKEELAESPQQALIYLTNHRNTIYANYLAVYNELKAAYDELREEWSHEHFSKPYEALNTEEKKQVRQAIPFMISEAEPTSPND